MRVLKAIGVAVLVATAALAQTAPTATVGELVTAVRGKAKTLENSSGMRHGFADFTAAYKLKPEEVSYSDYVTVRLFYEATRDAGLWNMHWTITDRDPNSDNVWKQWKVLDAPQYSKWTASAECDELSALYAFLVGRAGVHGVGLLWPYPNHTVATWVLRPAKGQEVRVVVPTSQIFLDAGDDFGTRKFDAWKQKTIFEYKRRDVADDFTIPRPLYDFFLAQIDKYGGASDLTLQQLRYLREAVFLNALTPRQAAADALHRREKFSGSLSKEDSAALWNFAQDMQASR